MKLAEGFLMFYSRLASGLDARIDPSAVELVVSGPPGFPDEDLLNLAFALALRSSDGFGRPGYIVLTNSDAFPHELDACTVVDMRALQTMPQIATEIISRPDLVFLRDAAQASLECPKVLFNRNHRLIFEAATSAFREIVELTRYSGQALEMPTRYIMRGFRSVADDFSLFDVRETGLTPSRIDRLIETVSMGWQYHGRQVDPDTVRRWLDQFGGEARVGAANVLSYIHAQGYHSTTEVAHTLLDLIASRAPSAQLVSLQPPGKSEHMLIYEMRKASMTITISDAISSGAIHLVCVDDVIGSGDTIIECLFERSTPVHDRIEQWISRENTRITVLAAVASESGIRRIESEPRAKGKIKVHAKTVMATEGGIFADNLRIFSSTEVKNAFLLACKSIGSTLIPAFPLGWGNCAWAIVTEYNVPDCSLPIIWSDSTLPIWHSLFRRR